MTVEATAESAAVDALVLDLLDWIGRGPRPYVEVMDAWRTSCPRLPVWEEANRLGYVEHSHRDGVGATVSVSVEGRRHLERRRSAPA